MEPHRCSQTVKIPLLLRVRIHTIFFAVADVAHSLRPCLPLLYEQPGLTLERTPWRTTSNIRQPEKDPTTIPTNVVRR